MKPIPIIKYTPITLILLFTIFGIPWKKNTDVITWRCENYERLLFDYVDQNTKRDENKRNCVRFLLPPNRKTKVIYPDTLDVHFTKDIFETVAISVSDYDVFKLDWNVGHVEYKTKPNNGYWTGLIPMLNRNESFVIPIIIQNGRMPRSELFLKLLPKELREDNQGNKAQVLL